jgi:hypothetical protein
MGCVPSTGTAMIDRTVLRGLGCLAALLLCLSYGTLCLLDSNHFLNLRHLLFEQLLNTVF